MKNAIILGVGMAIGMAAATSICTANSKTCFKKTKKAIVSKIDDLLN